MHPQSDPRALVRASVLATLVALGAASPVGAQVFVKLTDLANPIVADPGTTPATGYPGASWGDIDRDGWPDLVVARRGVYRNLGGGAFARWAGEPAQESAAQGTSLADIDDDGDLDLLLVGGFVPQSNPPRGGSGVHRNDGGTFVRVALGATADSAAFPGWSGAFADYDLDGRIDFAVVAANGFSTSGVTNSLLRGLGDGTFAFDTTTDVSVGLAPYTIGTWSDVDLDGDPDFSVGSGPGGAGVGLDRFYRNRTVEGGAPRLALDPLAPVGTTARDGQVWNWIDDDNDGDLDVFITNYGLRANELYRNVGGTYVKQASATAGTIVVDTQSSLSSVWGDFDNDGDLDCLVTNDASSRNRYYRNDGTGLYAAVGMGTLTTEAGPHHTAVAADYDRDGDLDLFLTGPSTGKGLYRNDLAAGRHWLEIALRGTTANAAAIGARVRVKATIGGSPRWQMREVSAQNSFNGHSDLTLHFGLGDAAVVDSLEITWPGGSVERAAGIAVDTVLVLAEGALSPVPVRLAPVGASVVRGAVRVSWYSSGDAPEALTVERSGVAADGTILDAWEERARLGTSGGLIVFEDRDVRSGSGYGYRLAWSEGNVRHASEPLIVTVPRTQFALRLAGGRPGRVGGELRFEVDAPVAGRAELVLWDATGRRRAGHGPVPILAGTQVLRLVPPSRLDAGVYFARVTLGTERAETRVVLLP